MRAFPETNFWDLNSKLNNFKLDSDPRWSVPGDNCLRWECFRWELPLIGIFWVGIDRAVVLFGMSFSVGSSVLGFVFHFANSSCSTIWIVVSDKSMDRQYYDPIRNTEPFKYKSSSFFIGHVVFMFEKNASKLSSLKMYCIRYIIQNK